MAMSRWNPVTEMMTLHDAMDRLLADSFVRPFSGLTQTLETTMPLDMYEENNQLVVKTSMPGVRPEDINIEVQDNILTISGEIKKEDGQSGNGGQQPAMGRQGQAQGQQQATGGQGKPQGQAQGQQMQTQGQQQMQTQQGNGQNWYMREHVYARFVRSVTLPYPVQADKAEATLENGVLTLRFPKAEQPKQKKIQVKAK